MKLSKDNLLTDERIDAALRHRFNPTRTITPDALATAHDEFDRGYLRNAALMWEVIEDRDDLVKSVAAKRKKNIARNGFEVVTFCKECADNYGEALRQKAALEFFYSQVRVTNAIDANERGGFKLLIRQMMDAVGKKYAVHEIIWKPQRRSPLPQGEGGRRPGEGPDSLPENDSALASPARTTRNLSLPEFGLTAELRFVPLWFFENTKGRLRFLKSPYAMEGVDMAPARGS